MRLTDCGWRAAFTVAGLLIYWLNGTSVRKSPLVDGASTLIGGNWPPMLRVDLTYGESKPSGYLEASLNIALPAIFCALCVTPILVGLFWAVPAADGLVVRDAPSYLFYYLACSNLICLLYSIIRLMLSINLD